MSGFEIAGIVLGLIPLVVKAAEDYAAGLSTIQRWRKYEREVQSLARNLETEHARLKNVCEKLLLGLVPHSQIESMIKDAFGDPWREDATHRMIRARLWECFDVFEANILHVKTALDEIGRKVEMQNGSGRALDLKRAKFTLTRSSYRDLLTTIKDGISTLENLIDRNIELEPERKVRSQRKMLGILREISKSLYQGLRSSLDLACKHQLGLKLRRQSAHITPADDDSHILKDLEFHIALSHATVSARTDTGNEPTIDWEELLVKVATNLNTPVVFDVAKSVTPPSRPKRSKGKSVTFAGSRMMHASSTSTLVQTEVETSLNKPVSENGKIHANISESMSDLATGVASIRLSGFGAIANLCEKLRAAQKLAPAETYGIIEDHQSQTTRRYSISPNTTPSSELGNSLSVVSLKEILAKRCLSPPLPYRDRLELGAVISYSTLQLHGSPWVSEVIRSDDIFFVQKHEYPIYAHPFVIKSFPESHPDIPQGKSDLPFGRNPVLFSLGILLIELHMGRTFESLKETANKEGLAQGALVDYITAQRMLDQLRLASPNYFTAVSRCIDGDLHTRNAGLDDKDFCHDVYSGVVAALDRDLENA